MTRFLLFLLFAGFGIAISIGLKSHMASDPISGPPTTDFGSEVAILGDGTPMFAPRGTVARQLADWLADPNSRERYFEVGGTQFRRDEIRPVPEAEARLRRLATLLQAYPKVEARIVGYAASSGNSSADGLLARRRSMQVVDILTADGIARSRLGVAEAPIGPAGVPGNTPADRIGVILRYQDPSSVNRP
jgi:hypothetical protein